MIADSFCLLFFRRAKNTPQCLAARTDDGATFDRDVTIDASTLTPFVTWGTNPGQGLPLASNVPDPSSYAFAPSEP